MPELCFNLWYYLRPDQKIHALALKAYLLDGSEEEMADVLRILSRRDYKTVPIYELPADMMKQYPHGMPYGLLKDLGVDQIFENVFKEATRNLHKDVIAPDDKLFFATPLFDFGEGFSPAEIGDGFIRDRD